MVQHKYATENILADKAYEVKNTCKQNAAQSLE